MGYAGSVCVAQDAALEDTRPPFDKSAYRGTAWSQANPWWLPNRSRTYAGGGPDFAWHKYSDDGVEMWRQVALRCKPYGLTGLQGEVLAPSGYENIWRNMLLGFEKAGNGFMLEPFITGAKGGEEVEKVVEGLMPELKQHSNVLRLDDAPVVILYSPGGEPKQWQETIAAIESKHGRMIWLMDAAHASADKIRRFMPVFDGVSMYANWSEEGQRKLYGEIGPVMRTEFPHKIFEGGVHTTYMVHFHYGGVAPKLTEKFRNSWDIALEAKPDSVAITNFFDCYENSRILPSYEMDDILLRISQDRLARWREQSPPASDEPDLYVANYTNVILGQDMDFEVIGFPLKGENKTVAVKLDICDSAEKVLHSFPEREMVLDAMKVETFSLPSEGFCEHLCVHPRVQYTRGGQTLDSYLLPQTNLVTSLRPHMLFWCRALNHVIRIDTSREWTMNAAGPGEPLAWPKDAVGLIRSHAFSQGMRGVKNRGGGWVRVLRNGREIESFAKWDLRFLWPVRLPDPVGALDWYNLELESAECKYLSPPIWVGGAMRPGEVDLPIRTSVGEVSSVRVDAARVPYFMYECDTDTGALLMDSSGYEHHGYLGGKGYGGGHLAYTAYRHEHKGLLSQTHEGYPKWAKDADGTGHLTFDGVSYVMIQGGTAFPYASTYELFVRPDKLGQRMGILGAANAQVNIYLTRDGHIEASRLGAVEGEGAATPNDAPKTTAKVLSQSTVPTDRWTHIAVVYDLKTLSLYLDGKLQGQAPLAPSPSAEWINAVVVGGTCAFPYKPRDFFIGDIRRLRIYGRNLAPVEFLSG